jgi:hypothetical protein
MEIVKYFFDRLGSLTLYEVIKKIIYQEFIAYDTLYVGSAVMPSMRNMPGMECLYPDLGLLHVPILVDANHRLRNRCFLVKVDYHIPHNHIHFGLSDIVLEVK